MKKLFAVIIAVILVLSMAACGAKPAEPAPAVESTPAPAAVPENTPAPAAAPEKTLEPTPEATPEPAPEKAFDEEAFKKAQALEGESVEELFDAIGEPLSIEEYTSSCMGKGEDGLFHYEGFDVYTYREGDSEVVYTVLKN